MHGCGLGFRVLVRLRLPEGLRITAKGKGNAKEGRGGMAKRRARVQG